MAGGSSGAGRKGRLAGRGGSLVGSGLGGVGGRSRVGDQGQGKGWTSDFGLGRSRG